MFNSGTSDDEQFMLYFSSVPCAFDVAEGVFESFVLCEYDEKSLEAVLARGRDCVDPVVVPAIPSLDFKAGKGSLTVAGLEMPLVKSANGALKGWKSGVRSALIRIGEKVYRLKVAPCFVLLVL